MHTHLINNNKPLTIIRHTALYKWKFYREEGEFDGGIKAPEQKMKSIFNISFALQHIA